MGEINLEDLINTGIVFFCGAGISMIPPSSLPSWWELNEQVMIALGERVEGYWGGDKTMETISRINSRRDENRFPPEYQADLITQYYGDSYFKVLECLDSETPNVVHKMIAQLAALGHVKAIITSNFDTLIERAFTDENVPLDIFYTKDDFEELLSNIRSARSENVCKLVKLHGSVVDHLSLVDTLAQRMRGLPSSLHNVLQLLLEKHYWIFLGYSGADLEGNPEYMGLRSAIPKAMGYTWLVRDSVNNEPKKAVIDLSEAFGKKADIVRGELPDWLFMTFESYLQNIKPSPFITEESNSSLLKKEASNIVERHCHEWASEIDELRAAFIISTIVDDVLSDSQEALDLLETVQAKLSQDTQGYSSIANARANILINLGQLEKAEAAVNEALQYIPNQNTDLINMINSTAGLIAHEQGNYLKALAIYQEIYKVAEKGTDKNFKGVVLHNMARELSEMGRYDEAINRLEEELIIVIEMGNASAQGVALNNMGDIERDRGNYKQALHHFNKSIEIRDRLGDDKGVADSLGNIGILKLERGYLDEAKEAIEKVHQIFKRIGNIAGQITSLFNLGEVELRKGNLAAAEDIFLRGLLIATNNNRKDHIAKGKWKIASILSRSEKYDEAHRFYNEAFSIYKENGNKSGQADVLNELGNLYLAQSYLEKAKNMYQDALVLYEEMKRPRDIAAVLGNLALVELYHNRFEAAILIINKTIKIGKEIGAEEIVAYAYFSKGNVLQHMHSMEEALSNFAESLRIYETLERQYEIIWLSAVIGAIMGINEKHKEAEFYFNKATRNISMAEHTKLLLQYLYQVVQNQEESRISSPSIYFDLIKSLEDKFITEKLN